MGYGAVLPGEQTGPASAYERCGATTWMRQVMWMLPAAGPSDQTEHSRRGAPKAWAASTGFVMIHYDLLDALGGSYAAAALWERIRYRSERDGWWEATREAMCAETRLTPKVLRRALEELREAGLIESERVTPFRPQLRWRVVWADDESAGQDVKAERAITTEPVAERAITVMAERATSLSSETGREELPPVVPQRTAPDEDQGELPLLAVIAADEPTGVEAEFDGFWKAYPRKVGKPKARRAYLAARKRASLDEIAAGLRAQLPDMRVREPGFIPHPTTWLNQDRWADDPAAAATRTGPRNFDLERMQARNAGDPTTQLSSTTTLTLALMRGTTDAHDHS